MKRKISFSYNSQKGKRTVNQDALSCTFNKNGDFCAIVCDGVGSVGGSEVASKLVTKIFSDSFKETYTFNAPTVWFKENLNRALKELKIEAEKIGKPNISTTLAVLVLANGKYYAYNIGDTRIYKKTSDEKIVICSYDHNYKNYLISKGFKGARLEDYKDRWNALTAFIDPSHPKLARFEFNSGELEDDIWFTLSTDGVYHYISRYSVVDITFKRIPFKRLSKKINNIALKNLSPDNVTNIIIWVK